MMEWYFTGLKPRHNSVSVSREDLDFQRGLFMFIDWRWEVRFVEIGGIYCWQSLFNFLFTNKCQTGEILWHRQIINFFYEIDYFFHEMLFIDTKKERKTFVI